MDYIIKAENVFFEYPTESGEPRNAAVNDVTLSIEKGSFVVILGHNGSGKSTLAKLFNGILIPTSGKVTVNGHDTADEEKLFDIRKDVGMVFQNPDNQLVATVVEEDVAFAPENLGLPPEEIRRRVDEALKTVGMSEYAQNAPHKLSGGQKQRVAIAGILAMMPQCIIFDESTAMLDPYGRKEITDTIKKLNASGLTVILITHYMDEATSADRVIVMNDGKIEKDDTPKNVFSDPRGLSRIGLDVPQVTELMDLLATNREISKLYDIPKGVIDVKEASEVIEGMFNKRK